MFQESITALEIKQHETQLQHIADLAIQKQMADLAVQELRRSNDSIYELRVSSVVTPLAAAITPVVTIPVVVAPVKKVEYAPPSWFSDDAIAKENDPQQRTRGTRQSSLR